MNTMPSTKTRKNRLSTELSPYLRQHATNPVDWYPWGDEAFRQAKEQDKPVFLSIGYATCHWCHVMAHESFEDEQVAKILNDTFICIKVDREERPDIDIMYMKACHLLSGAGGWPLTIIMTPEKKPFFAATYLPKTTRLGMRGLIELSLQIKELWQTQRMNLNNTAETIQNSLATRPFSKPSPTELDSKLLDYAYEALLATFDEQYGGFSPSPKFPTPHHLLFLLRYWKRTQNHYALTMVKRTLEQMRLGGIFDQVGYGFHRYATDQEWNVPHFEKMLYDQALLLIAYTEAFQATQEPLFQQVAQEIITYIAREMTSPHGGFFTAQDADSEGEEGKYYTWTLEELRRLLSAEDFQLATRLYGFDKDPAQLQQASREESPRQILSHERSFQESAAALGLSQASLMTRLQRIADTLYSARIEKTPPLKDDKILSDWNGLMIAALAKAGMVFDDKVAVRMAEHAAVFLCQTMIKKTGRMLHRFRNGHAGIPGFADDYAFTTWGFLELYQTTFNIRYLQTALSLNQYFIAHFWDDEHSGFFFTEATASVLFRSKEWYDGAVPSANSVQTLNLLRLGRLTTATTFEQMAGSLLRCVGSEVQSHPEGYTSLLTGVDFLLGPSQEIILVGELGTKGAESLLASIRHLFLPHVVVVLLPPGRDAVRYQKIFPFSSSYHQIDKKPTAYVCTNHQCHPPVCGVSQLTKLLL